MKFFFRYVLGLQEAEDGRAPCGRDRSRRVQQLEPRPVAAADAVRWLELLYAAYTAAWTAGQAEEPVAWDNPGVEAEQKQIGWRLLETFFRESPIREAGKPDAVEVSVEADLASHGLPTLVGVLDLVQNESIIDFKTTRHDAQPGACRPGQRHAGHRVLAPLPGEHRQKGSRHRVAPSGQAQAAQARGHPLPPGERSKPALRVIDPTSRAGRRDFIPSPGLQCASCEFFRMRGLALTYPPSTAAPFHPARHFTSTHETTNRHLHHAFILLAIVLLQLPLSDDRNQ